MRHEIYDSIAQESLKHLNLLLLNERRRSALPWGEPVKMGSASLLVLIDADSLSDLEIANKIKSLAAHALRLSVHVCANRDLKRAEEYTAQRLKNHRSERQTEIAFTSVSPGHNLADEHLIELASDALAADRFGGVLVLTQDRDLFPIIDSWRIAQKASFISPLRLDESGKHLILRCKQRGYSIIDCDLNDLYLTAMGKS